MQPLTSARLRELPEEVQAKFVRLLQLLREGNERLNLTTITEPEAVERLHFEDSLSGLDAYPELLDAKVAADIGSGAGFPLFPLAVLTPGCQWHAVESIAKKARYIEETAAELALGNVEARAERAEDAGRSELREACDVVTARAVGAVAALCEVGLPLVKTGGMLLLYKTEAAVEELDGLRGTVGSLGGEIEGPFRYRLAGDAQDRVILKIRKVGPTPAKYPRAAGVPFKKPLKG